MGILSKLFGSAKTSEAASKTLEYNGYLISAAPFKAAAGWQLAGTIAKGGKVHKFVRADQFSSSDEAAEFALIKGKLIIDQLGDQIFA
jgi:hypothetical protein